MSIDGPHGRVLRGFAPDASAGRSWWGSEGGGMNEETGGVCEGLLSIYIDDSNRIFLRMFDDESRRERK